MCIAYVTELRRSVCTRATINPHLAPGLSVGGILGILPIYLGCLRRDQLLPKSVASQAPLSHSQLFVDRHVPAGGCSFLQSRRGIERLEFSCADDGHSVPQRPTASTATSHSICETAIFCFGAHQSKVQLCRNELPAFPPQFSLLALTQTPQMNQMRVVGM